LAVLFAFAVGYILVSFLARLMKTEPPAMRPTMTEMPLSSAGQKPISAVDEERYFRVLGAKSDTTAAELEQAYHDSLAKYHPDKVADLDEEFRRLAQQRTKEIEEAYAILKQHRGIQ
jgi:DnaJ like chaperone protein